MEVDKDEKSSPKIPSSLHPQIFSTSSFFVLLFPISHPNQSPSPPTNTKPGMSLRMRQRDIPAGIWGLVWGQKGQGYPPASQASWAWDPFQEEKSYRVNSAEKTDLKLSLGFQEEGVDELVLLGNI